jgi:hypothetical protein
MAASIVAHCREMQVKGTEPDCRCLLPVTPEMSMTQEKAEFDD